MRRFVFIFPPLLLMLLVSPISASEDQRVDPEYVAWYLEQLPVEKRREIGALQYVLTREELGELLSLSYEHARRRWIDDYWSRRDPVYTSGENEIRAEHNRRVAFAESQFYVAKWPMWDQRGEVYIRYGAPSGRYDWPSEVTPGGIIRAGEIWFYPQHDMNVLFEDAFGNGEYTYYLGRAHGPRNPRMDRLHPIDKLMGAVRPLQSAESMKQYEDYEKSIFRSYEVMEAVPSSYWYDFESNQQPFVFSVDEFRGGDWVDRVDVNFEFMADLSSGPIDAETKKFVTTAVFWDTEQNEVGRRTQSLEFPMAKEVTDFTRLIPAQLVFSLNPGFYHMAVTVEDLTYGKVSSYRQDVTCVDFESNLAISDILFASKIAPVTQPSPFNRGPLEVVPHPIRRYGKSESIPVYFEVYNLNVGEGNLASYTVEYEVISQSKKDSGVWDLFRRDASMIDISSSFQTTTYGSQDVVHILLNSESLRNGEFVLRVRIQDDLTEAEVDREVVFTIEE